MSFRGVDRNLQQYLRGLQDQINDLKSGVGKDRQNTIRLGDWVLEPYDDKLVKMYNLVTGAESFVGTPEDDQQGSDYLDVDEIVFSFEGELNTYYQSPRWSAIYDLSIIEIDFVLANETVWGGVAAQLDITNRTDYGSVTLWEHTIDALDDSYHLTEFTPYPGIEKGNFLTLLLGPLDFGEPVSDVTIHVRYIPGLGIVAPWNVES